MNRPPTPLSYLKDIRRILSISVAIFVLFGASLSSASTLCIARCDGSPSPFDLFPSPPFPPLVSDPVDIVFVPITVSLVLDAVTLEGPIHVLGDVVLHVSSGIIGSHDD